MSWMRGPADALCDIFGIRMARKGNVWTLVEPEQLSRFLDAFKVDCVFDVGANEGQYALRLRKIGYAGRIISFEPNPHLAGTLERLTAKDPLWSFEPVALDSEERDAEFNIISESQLSSLNSPSKAGTEVFEHYIDVLEKVTVQTRTLAAMFPELRQRYGFTRPFLKMDTQGHDLAVAQGAGDLLGQFVGLQSELAFTRLYDDSASYAQALEFYRSKSFALSGLFPNNEGLFPDLLEMDCLMYNTRLPGRPTRS
jgi:FkbM family methyltransferase